MKTTQDLITRLLRNLGSRKEVEQYLRLFSSHGADRFAVIQASGDVVSGDVESLASSIAFLSQVGLTPLVVLGGADDPAADGSLESIRRFLEERSLRLADALEEIGTRARPITGGVFEVISPGIGSSADTLVRTRLEPIHGALRSGSVPIMPSLGASPSGQILALSPEVATSALALAIEPFKVVILEEAGGLIDNSGQLISAVNLAEDYVPLLEQGDLTPSAKKRVIEIKELLDRLPSTTSVSITSPDHLARELFTHRGSGTLVKQGEKVELLEADEIGQIDCARLRALLEQCFQRTLSPSYFEDHQFLRVYLADTYRATAILTDGGRSDVPYLDKFAVTQEAQGAGVGGSIWQRMRRDNPRLYWRSRVENPVNTFYFEQSGGSFKSSRWTVFWYGLSDYDAIRNCVESALAMAPSLTDAPPSVVSK